MVIVIRGRRIESVGEAGAIEAPPGAKIIDLSQATVLPGMIDSHTHIFLQGEDPAEGGYDAQLLKYGMAFRAARATVSARRALEPGFTTIRDVETEGAGYGDVGIKQAKDESKGMATLDGLCAEGFLGGCTQRAVLHAGRQTKEDIARAKDLLKKACGGGDAEACRLQSSMPR